MTLCKHRLDRQMTLLSVELQSHLLVSTFNNVSLGRVFLSFEGVIHLLRKLFLRIS